LDGFVLRQYSLPNGIATNCRMTPFSATKPSSHGFSGAEIAFVTINHGMHAAIRIRDTFSNNSM
jgi:hypothetical protein